MCIQGEHGRDQMILPDENAARVVARSMIDGIIGDGQSIPSRMSIGVQQKVAVLINNLGGLPAIEMLIMSKEILLYLKERNLQPVRVYVGSLMTSLEMAGLSVSLLLLPDGNSSTTTTNNISNPLDWLDYATSA